MGKAWAWIKQHPASLLLIAAVVVGQVLQSVLGTTIERSSSGGFPVVAGVALAVALALAVVIIVVRVRLGHEVLAAARARALNLPATESLPARYAVADPPGQLVGAGLALLDVALVLLVQNTLRTPVLVIASDYVPRSRAEAVFVGIVVVVALIVIVKLYRTGWPVLVLTLWWGLDRMVPTAGFLGARPAPAVAAPRTASLPSATPSRAATPTPATPPSVAVAEPTVVSSRGGEEATVVATRNEDATVVAPPRTVDPLDGPTMISTRRPPPPSDDDDATVVS